MLAWIKKVVVTAGLVVVIVFLFDRFELAHHVRALAAQLF